MQAVHDIARALGVPRRDIGFAGLKDARAVTEQWLSVEHIDPERVAALDLPRLRVLATTRHHNKLRLGHLAGNEFTIRVRASQPERLPDLQQALATLAARGVPNYFGEQRFGYRGDTWAIGRALLRNDIDEAVDLMLGRAAAHDSGPVRRARELYDAGDYENAAHAWPRMFRTEQRAARALARRGGNRRRALATVDKQTRTFFVSAYQSHLFNRIVVQRLPQGLDTLHEGDLAWLHASGAVFHVQNVAAEAPRAHAFEISPTGPLFGYRMTEPFGIPQELEQHTLEQEGLTLNSFQANPLRIKGARRALRFPPRETDIALGADARGPYLEVRFVLPSGCYATVLLRELFRLRSGDGHRSGGGDPEALSP